MAILEPPPPPPDLIKNSQGNFFVYAYVFDRSRFPAYAEHIPTGGVQWIPELMVSKAAAHLGMSGRYGHPSVLPVPLQAIRDVLAPDQPMPCDSLSAPHFLIYADYKIPAPGQGVVMPKLRNYVAEADPEKLRKFEEAFGVEGERPRWYCTRTWRQ